MLVKGATGVFHILQFIPSLEYKSHTNETHENKSDWSIEMIFVDENIPWRWMNA